MGNLLSRFRKNKTTNDELEEIEQKLKCIEEFQTDTHRKQRKIIGTLIVYSVIIYVAFALLFYFYYFPNEIFKQLLYSIPLLVFPVLVWISRKVLNWHFKKRIVRHEQDISDLKKKKRKILDNVMETETYKVARDILEKYDKDHTKKPENGANLPGLFSQLPSLTSDLRRRSMPVNTVTPSMPTLPSVGRPAELSCNPTPLALREISAHKIQGPSPRPPGPPLPRPVPPRDRSVFERLVDYAMGEGPGSRFALICKMCQSHNGLASPYEYEYLAFRCCYCYHWNPAKKLRPLAPSLPQLSASGDALSRSDSDLRLTGRNASDLLLAGSSASEGESEKGSRPVTPQPNADSQENAVEGEQCREGGDKTRTENIGVTGD